MLIWDGEEQHGTDWIEDGHKHGAPDGKPCWFEPPYAGCKSRKDRIDLITFHWTAGEGSAEQVARVLRNRADPATGKPTPLSIHFVIDYYGKVMQQADPVRTVCYHAGKVNSRSIGIEMANRALPPASAEHARGLRSTIIEDGHAFTHLDFTDAQYASALKLANVLALLSKIPALVPLDARKTDLSTFRGACEHIHAGSKSHKTDCAGAIMGYLGRNGWAQLSLPKG
jgi:hypothetical protein